MVETGWFPHFTILILFCTIVYPPDTFTLHPLWKNWMHIYACSVLASFLFALPLEKTPCCMASTASILVSFRVLGTCAVFWIASLFVKKGNRPMQGCSFSRAVVLGLILNQCPVSGGIATHISRQCQYWDDRHTDNHFDTFCFYILKEPVTWKKILGIAIGCAGALMLIMTSVNRATAKWETFGATSLSSRHRHFIPLPHSFTNFTKRYSVFTANNLVILWALSLSGRSRSGTCPIPTLPLATCIRVDGDGICHHFRDIPGLSDYLESTENTHPDHCEHLQLCATHCGGGSQRVDGHRSLQVEPGRPSCRLLRRLAD